MTCIIGIVDKKKVYIGGDSAGISGYSLTIRKDPKVFTIGEFAFGFTTSFRMGQLLMHGFKPPPVNGSDLYQYMCTSFIDAVRARFKDGGFAEKNNEVEFGGVFLVGVRRRLFQVGSDYQIGEPIDKIDACGCGQDIALGSLYSQSTTVSAKTRILNALKAAEHFNAGVRGPFRVVSV